jgi:hypothetical protein
MLDSTLPLIDIMRSFAILASPSTNLAVPSIIKDAGCPAVIPPTIGNGHL